MHQIRGQIKTLVVELYPGHRHREVSAAVVGIGARDDFLFGFFTQSIEVVMNDTDRGVVGHRATGSEENMVQGGGGQLGELRGKLRRRRGGEMAEGRVIRHPPGLVGDGLRHFVVAVADIDTP